MIPSWFTLNLSCPNTEDDPRGNQTEDKARHLCGSIVDYLYQYANNVPLWVKIGPTLSEAQVAALMHAFAETGVRAVVATNTLPAPTPNDASTIAGIAGGRLHRPAVEIACLFAEQQAQHSYPVDVIGCGGIDSGKTYADFTQYSIRAVQYLSAMIYRGPLAAALIQREASHG
jgi:dihydroorotate dehydrogenase